MGQRKRSLVKARRMAGMRKSMGATTGTTGNFVVNGRSYTQATPEKAAHAAWRDNKTCLRVTVTDKEGKDWGFYAGDWEDGARYIAKHRLRTKRGQRVKGDALYAVPAGGKEAQRDQWKPRPDMWKPVVTSFTFCAPK